LPLPSKCFNAVRVISSILCGPWVMQSRTSHANMSAACRGRKVISLRKIGGDPTWRLRSVTPISSTFCLTQSHFDFAISPNFPRGGAERGAGSCPSWRPRRRRFLFGFIGWWPARPSHGVSFADGRLATTGEGGTRSPARAGWAALRLLAPPSLLVERVHS
jgi:hypothetical protein